jgi:hypothetical protein
MKLASMSAALAVTARGRGVGDPAATLAAEVAISAFRIALNAGSTSPNQRDLPELIRESLNELKAVTAEDRRSPSASAQPSAVTRPQSKPRPLTLDLAIQQEIRVHSRSRQSMQRECRVHAKALVRRGRAATRPIHPKRQLYELPTRGF